MGIVTVMSSDVLSGQDFLTWHASQSGFCGSPGDLILTESWLGLPTIVGTVNGSRRSGDPALQEAAGCPRIQALCSTKNALRIEELDMKD